MKKREVPQILADWWKGRLQAQRQLHDSTVDMITGEGYDFKSTGSTWLKWVATPVLMLDFVEWCSEQAKYESDPARRRELERAADRTHLSTFSSDFNNLDTHARKHRTRVRLEMDGSDAKIVSFRNGYEFDILPAHVEVSNVREYGTRYPELLTH